MLGRKSARKAAEDLAGALIPPLNAIAMAVAGYISSEDLATTLAEQRPLIAKLKETLDDQGIHNAYERYWGREVIVLNEFFSRGHATVSDVRDLQREWLTTLDLQILHQLASEGEATQPGRLWTADTSDVEYTYIESIRANVPDELDNYEGLRSLEDLLATARNGLAFAGMMFGDRRPGPISPMWVGKL